MSDSLPRPLDLIESHHEALMESLAWAFAVRRLGRPEDQIFPEELSPKDWRNAGTALEAVTEHFREVSSVDA